MAFRRPAADHTAVLRFRREIAELMRKHAVPGLAVAVVDLRRILWAEGFGHTDRSGRIRVTPKTPFSVQSTSKTTTASGTSRTAGVTSGSSHT